MIPLSRILKIVEKHLKEMGYGKGVCIRRGKIVIEIQIDNEREALIVKKGGNSKKLWINYRNNWLFSLVHARSRGCGRYWLLLPNRSVDSANEKFSRVSYYQGMPRLFYYPIHV